MIEVYPSQRVNSHMVPEEDSIVCDKAGTCKFKSLYFNKIVGYSERFIGKFILIYKCYGCKIPFKIL